MPQRRAAEAIRLHLQRAQRLAACITNKVLRVDGYDASGDERYLAFPGEPADLAGVRLKLLAGEYFRAFDLPGSTSDRIITVGYRYGLRDAGDNEVLSYHWHPRTRSRMRQPHLHLGPAAQVKQRDLAAVHLPTGIISLPDIVELVIGEFGVEPRVEGWRDVVAEARANR